MFAKVRLLVILVAFACGGSPAWQVAAPEPSISLLDPGAAPRRRLRYEPKLHAPERLEIRLKTAMETAFTNTVLETGRQRADLPTVRVAGRLEVTAFTPEGDAVVTCEVERAEVLDDVVDPALRRLLEAEIATMTGQRWSWRMSPSGALSQIAIEASSGSIRSRASSLRESIQSASVVFPDAEIGVGATWQVTSRQSHAGVRWERTATYRLRELAGSIATIDADLVMRAPSQALSVEPNASTRLTSGTGKVSAELIIPLDGLVTTVLSRGTSEMNFSIIRGRLRITSTVQTETLFSAKPLGAAKSGDGSITGLPIGDP